MRTNKNIPFLSRVIAALIVCIMAFSAISCTKNNAAHNSAEPTAAPSSEPTEAPDTEAPNTEAPDTETPETEAPGKEALNAGVSENEASLPDDTKIIEWKNLPLHDDWYNVNENVAIELSLYEIMMRHEEFLGSIENENAVFGVALYTGDLYKSNESSYELNKSLLQADADYFNKNGLGYNMKYAMYYFEPAECWICFLYGYLTLEQLLAYPESSQGNHFIIQELNHFCRSRSIPISKLDTLEGHEVVYISYT